MNIAPLTPELVDLWESFVRARNEPFPPMGSLGDTSDCVSFQFSQEMMGAHYNDASLP